MRGVTATSVTSYQIAPTAHLSSYTAPELRVKLSLMKPAHTKLSRRSFIAATAATVACAAIPRTWAAAGQPIPIGLELYSVRDELAKDLPATVRAVAKMGYEVVEFYSPYFSWSLEKAKEVRKLLDDLGIKCKSTHNGMNTLKPDGIAKAIDLNQTIGAKYIVLASAGQPKGIDGWKGVAETLTQAAEKLRPLGLRTGYHNHQTEFTALEGKRPMEVLAANTPKDVMLQLDVGTCVEVGSDPVAWVNANPGRINSLHLKDWLSGNGPDHGYQALFGEGSVPWKKLLEAAEEKGGVEFYLIEQEGSRYPSLETAAKCLEAYKKLRG